MYNIKGVTYREKLIKIDSANNQAIHCVNLDPL